MKTFFVILRFFQIFFVISIFFVQTDSFCLDIFPNKNTTKSDVSRQYQIPLSIIEYYNTAENDEFSGKIFIPDEILNDLHEKRIITYEVKYKDTLSKISKKYNKTPWDIFYLNDCISDIDLIYTGNVIFIHVDDSIQSNYAQFFRNTNSINNYDETPEHHPVQNLQIDSVAAFPAGYFHSRLNPSLKTEISYSRNLLNKEYFFASFDFSFTQFKSVEKQDIGNFGIKIFSLSTAFKYECKINSYTLEFSAKGNMNYLSMNFEIGNDTEDYYYPGVSLETEISRKIIEHYNAGLLFGYDVIFSRPVYIQCINFGISLSRQF